MRNEDDFFQYRDELPRGREIGLSITTRPLDFWVIYHRPKDLPATEYVARRWRAEPGFLGPTLEYHAAPLEELRAELDRAGLVRVLTDDGDDPVIVETWI